MRSYSKNSESWLCGMPNPWPSSCTSSGIPQIKLRIRTLKPLKSCSHYSMSNRLEFNFYTLDRQTILLALSFEIFFCNVCQLYRYISWYSDPITQFFSPHPMQYQDLPFFILFLAAIYLTVIYGVLKLAARHPQKDCSSSLTINSK